MDKSEEHSDSSHLNTPQFSFKSKEASKYLHPDEFIGEFSPGNMQDKYNRALLEARSSDLDSFDELENVDFMHRPEEEDLDPFNQTVEQLGNESKEFITDILLNSPEEASENQKSEFLESRVKISRTPLIEDDLALSESWKSLRNLDKGKVQEIAKLKKELRELKESLVEEQDEISILKAEHPMQDMEKYLREQSEIDSLMGTHANIEPSSEVEIKSYYENLLKERLEEERRKITREISSKMQPKPERSYSPQPGARKQLGPDSNKKLNTMEEMELQNYKENLQIDYQMRLFSEKESWNTELTPIVIEETQREIEKSLRAEVDAFRETSLKKAMLDANSMVDKIRADTDESLAKSFAHLESQFDSEFERAKEQVWAETIEQLRYDQEYKLKQELMEKMRDNIAQSIRNELSEPIRQEVKQNLTHKIRREIQRDFDNKFAALRDKCETETENKIISLQESFSKSHNEEVAARVNEVLGKKEKELLINYMKNLEKNKQNLQREIASQYDKDIKEAKEIVNEIRSEVARLKSKLNINMKKLSSLRAEKLQDIKKQQTELERKMKNAEIQQRAIDESFTVANVPKKRVPSKSPIREKPSQLRQNTGQYTPEKSTPVPHRAPMLISSRETRIEPDYLLNNASIKPPPSYTYSGKTPSNSLKSTLDARQMHPCINRKVIEQAPSHDVVAQLIMKNLEEAKQQAIKLLKETERPGSLYYKSIL